MSKFKSSIDLEYSIEEFREFLAILKMLTKQSNKLWKMQKINLQATRLRRLNNQKMHSIYQGYNQEIGNLEMKFNRNNHSGRTIQNILRVVNNNFHKKTILNMLKKIKRNF